ncbi:hypothetical protein P355_1747 [Burkholderia cenocepacia KC-01]|nr:hypothetical protein P355_1747 [Burkholderia cenocepacia KC-01]
MLDEPGNHHPTSSIDVEPRDLPSGAQNIAGPCGGRMKRGFLFSVKRNQSQMT